MTTTPVDPEAFSCRTCAVEYGDDARPDLCPICADERQYLPAEGQVWITQRERARTTVVTVDEYGPDHWGVTAKDVGIGQTMQVIRTADGLVLWDPVGYADVATVEFLRSLGPTLAIVASHPHMYGCQVTWSRALGDAPVLVNTADRSWVQRPADVVQEWSGTRRLSDGVELRTLGGHFPGSSIVHWTDGAGGAGTVLASDTIMVNPDRATTSFLRSYPNRIPLSAAVVERLAADIADLRYTALWSNFGNVIPSGADAAVQRSAERHCAWARGDHDDLT